MTVDAEKLIERRRLIANARSVPESRGNALVQALAAELEEVTSEGVALADTVERLAAERDEARRERDAARQAAAANEEWAGVMQHERDFEQEVVSADLYNRLEAAEADRDRLAAALREAQAKQPATLERLREQGVVFDKAPKLPPDDWQQIAFWIYTDLCEVEMIARAALAAVAEPETEESE